MKVRVARDPDDNGTDAVDVGALSQPHWDLFTGGSQKLLEDWGLFAYTSCTKVPNVAHWGSHGDCPHRIKVFVSEVGSDPAAYASLVSAAGTRPTSKPTTAELRISELARSLVTTFHRALEAKYLDSDMVQWRQLMERGTAILGEMKELLEAYIASEFRTSERPSRS